jgi:acyl carrier protein phosphodiesterase
MNFLAHFFLSLDDEEWLIGNFMGDFVSNKLLAELPPKVRQGVYLHRAIDTFTDAHALTRHSSSLLHSEFGKYSPVLIDIFYDHFLAIHFERYAPVSLPTFSQETYQTLAKHVALLPPRLQTIVAQMNAQDWLTHYATPFGIQKSLESLNRRARYANHLDTAHDALLLHFEALESNFLAFFPEIQTFIEKREWLKT